MHLAVDPIETIMDLLFEDRSRIGTIYFLMSEDNIKKQIRQPWVSFGSDAASIAAEGVFLKSAAHPRTYGNFARLLGRYVRNERVILRISYPQITPITQIQYKDTRSNLCCKLCTSCSFGKVLAALASNNNVEKAFNNPLNPVVLGTAWF